MGIKITTAPSKQLDANIQFTANQTGAKTPSIGTNCPMTSATNSAPYTWIKFKAADGTTVFSPAWK